MQIEFTVPVSVTVDVEDDTTVRPTYGAWPVAELVRIVARGALVDPDLEVKIETALRTFLKTDGGINTYLRLGD